jgi:isocitrate lyase
MARAFSAKIHTTLPDTKVYAIGLPYVLNASNDRETLATVKEMNRLLAELAKTEKNFGYIDLFSASVDDKGKSNIAIILADDLGYGDVQLLVICFLRNRCPALAACRVR